MPDSSRKRAALALVALVALACSSTELVPLVPDVDGVAVVQKAQLELRAEVQPGEHGVPNTFTPIKLSLTNRAASSVRVSLHDIELELLESGEKSEPVPPERIEPRPPVGLGVDPASPFASQTAASSAALAPPASAIAPDANTSFQSDAAHGRDVTADALRRVIMSTAFTGGEIASGDREEGLVYFATPPQHVRRLRLIVRVHARDGELPVQTIEVPYSVEG